MLSLCFSVVIHVGSAKVVLLAHMTGSEYTRNDAFNLGLKIGAQSFEFASVQSSLAG
jgi:hypothetical protein